ncbi:MAG: bifunctional 5,10-methylenetetrahydrofolate dehydrogenase/5,10-methenyltetrahydrofolate cyclohydrolase [Patescibacteria group bacterium]|jgi:methylenetetrahydrofolate dehydrogenase (NADP+)/methenyltetrahydrofolate cyclohydrolase
MAIIVDGNNLAQQIYQRLAAQVRTLMRQRHTPKLGVVLVGEDKPSQTYVNKKAAAAKKIGINFSLTTLPATTTTEQLSKVVRKLQQTRYGLTGLIIQLPLPAHIKSGKVLELIDPQRDVDCLTQTNLGKLVSGSYWLTPPTPGAILTILQQHKVLLKGKRVVIIGAGALVGRPLANLLIHQQASVSVLNKFTDHVEAYTKTADIIITGVGKHPILTGKMIKTGVVVIDAGVSFIDGKMYGDIDFPSVAKKANLVTPTPGGVGPLTVAKLIENTVQCTIKRYNEA